MSRGTQRLMILVNTWRPWRWRR